MGAIEKIQDMLSDVEATVRAEALRDVILDLEDFAKSADSDERPGLLAAIEIIRANNTVAGAAKKTVDPYDGAFDAGMPRPTRMIRDLSNR